MSVLKTEHLLSTKQKPLLPFEHGFESTVSYKYDQLNRLVSMDAYKGLNPQTNSWEPVAINDYKERISYDANGNILTYKRNGNDARPDMDDLAYSYKANTNQLDKAVDAATDVSAGEYDKYNDIKQGQANGNYQYDAIGNLISDVSEGISSIEWNVYGKIKSITKPGTVITYTYDASGNRISKGVNGKETWYVRDAGGNVMSIYSKDAAINGGNLTQSEIGLYGSSRLGMYNRSNDVQYPDLNSGKIYTFTRGEKFFELSNHLGNVLATVSDKKIQYSVDGTTVDSYNAEVISAQDYYPFGMLMPGRKYSVANVDYRYGFNGQEKSTEINGFENLYTAEFWEYDSRIGKRWNIDPKPTIGISDYATFANNPIGYNDVKGDTIFRPSLMPHTFEDPLKIVLYKTPLGKQLLNEYSKSSKENIYFYAFDLDKSSKNFKDDKAVILNAVTALTVKNNVSSNGELAINNWDPKVRAGGEQQLKFLNASGFNFNTSATISIIGLNTTDDQHLKYDKYDLAFAMYHEIYAHVKLSKTVQGGGAQHSAFGNYYYRAGMGLYDNEIVGGSLMVQGSEAWKVFKQILDLKIKNGDGTKQNQSDLKKMNQVDAAAADATKKKSKKR